ncbi:MAG: peptidoglycan DD-metalloendopeptidase family protein [Gammaproteobacteria bacterium]|nr:peptidoglycan DD-metalloendopeptidase family protein [Gammaproteobacteria bacterium]
MAVIALRIVRRMALIGLVAIGNSGCAKLGYPPVVERSPVFSERPATYLVHTGDTLYSIAWRFDLDFKVLARINGLKSPYVIQPGQRVRLQVLSSIPVRDKPVARQARTLRWRWPTDAPVSREYGRGNSGMDFTLASNQRVRSAAAGTVVYAGNGLAGYRYLTIIKHNELYLSAYSFHSAPHASEGDSIKAGGLVADIQGTGRANQTLHFEIRKEGEPVSPRSVIRQ